MEQAVETGKDKVKKICEILRKDTLEPALNEAEGIISDARVKADQIIAQAKEKATKLLAETDKEIEKKESIFKASLTQGSRQTMEWLRQEIEGNLINPSLNELIAKETSDPKVLAALISAIVKAVSDEGIETDLSAIISSSVKPEDVNGLLGNEILSKLKEKSVLLGPLKGGVEVKLHNEKVTIDMSNSALFDLIKRYVRKDFLQFFFISNT